MSQFASKLAFFRKQAGLTQSELAEKISMSTVQISKYERGLSVPRPDTLKKIAKALKIDTSELISYENPKGFLETIQNDNKRVTLSLTLASDDVTVVIDDKFLTSDESIFISEIRKLLIDYVNRNKGRANLDEFIKKLHLSSISFVFLPDHAFDITSDN